MTKTLTGGLVLAALLTMTVRPSQATCAWVLWQKAVTWEFGNAKNPIGKGWHLLRVFASLPACEGQLAATVEKHAAATGAPWTQESARSTGSTGSLQRSRADAEGQTTQDVDWLCLPDTMDPRKLPHPYGD